jgi:hypothetical protein
MNEYLYKPHFYAHIISAVCLVAAIILLVINYKKILRLDGIELIKIFALFSIAIAAHGDGHTTLEKEYGYDPVGVLLRK